MDGWYCTCYNLFCWCWCSISTRIKCCLSFFTYSLAWSALVMWAAPSDGKHWPLTLGRRDCQDRWLTTVTSSILIRFMTRSKLPAMSTAISISPTDFASETQQGYPQQPLCCTAGRFQGFTTTQKMRKIWADPQQIVAAESKLHKGVNHWQTDDSRNKIT